MAENFFSNTTLDFPNIDLKYPKISKRLPGVKTLALFLSSQEEQLFDIEYSISENNNSDSYYA